MSPNNDRCTSQTPVSPHRDQPDAVGATFSSSRPVIRSSRQSLRHVIKTHHRVYALGIICNREEQKYSLTDSIKGISGNSRPFDTASSCQYWGRRRYGPVQQAFEMA